MCRGAAAHTTRTAASEPASETVTAKRTVRPGEGRRRLEVRRSWGILPQTPWDLTHSCQSRRGKKAGRHKAAPSVLAPGSALRSVPTVAYPPPRSQGLYHAARGSETENTTRPTAWASHSKKTDPGLVRVECAQGRSNRHTKNPQEALDSGNSFRDACV